MSIPQWIRDDLDRRRVPYQTHHHEPAFTTQAVAAEDHVSGHRVGKVAVAMNRGKPVLLVLPATRKVDLKRARQQVASD